MRKSIQLMMNPCRVSVFTFICYVLMHGTILFVRGGKLETITALNVIENTHTDMCAYSAANLDLTLDFTLWNGYVNLAIYNSNYMTTLIYQNKGTLESYPDLTFFNLARNVVISGSPKVFSSGLAFEPSVFSRYKEFAPYAYYKNGVICLFDFSLAYEYQTSVEPEWYYNLKSRNWDNASSILSERHQRNGSIDIQDENTVMYFAQKEDGHWSQPYFDCGFSNIWLVTFSVPIFGQDATGQLVFKGVAFIDMNLNDTDINQCDLDEDEEYVDIFLNVFRGTHTCHPDTKCQFRPGLGFRTGGYNCLQVNGSLFNSEGKLLLILFGIGFQIFWTAW
ncbi:metabotropic glycine receptor-like [Mytilus edulis]|uniref:metabotropic glycine receptor-like n=1 Tax=Mytilus edulis TaxID=6550 RepID=UPI0039EE6986